MNTVLITGGTSGLGFELAKYFLRKGFNVYATGRDGIHISGLSERVKFIKVDFSDPSDVRKSIQNLLNQGIRFDIVINNAGVLSPPGFTKCSNGIEYTFQVNFLSHLLINELIIKEPVNRSPLIIVSVTSPVYKLVDPDFKLPEPEGYRSFKTYSESKYYMLFIGEYLMDKYPEGNLKFIGFNPGTFSSHIYRLQKGWFRNLYRIAGPFMKSPAKVAAKLGGVLAGKELINGMVYRNDNSYLKLKSDDKKAMAAFFSKCSELMV